MKKWLIMGAGVLALTMVALAVAYQVLLSRNFLVSQIESSIDSRIQIGGLRVSLFSIPAKAVISDVIVAKRDDAARKGVPHDDRAKLESGEIRADEIRFDVSLWELLSREIKVTQLKVVGVHADLVMNEQGELNIEPLFAAPPETGKKKERKKNKGLNAKDSPDVVTSLDSIIIQNAAFNMVIEKTGLEIIGRDLNLELSDIKVDPNALEQVNEARMRFAARFEAFSSGKDRIKYGQLGLDGPARLRLFDPATGALDPIAEIDFAIDPSSHISTKAPYVVKLWDVTETLRKIGLKSEPLPDQLTFGRGRKLDASYARNKLDLHEPVSLVLEDWELALEGGSWVELGNEQHASTVRLIASAKVSDYVSKHLDKIIRIAPEKMRAALKEEILKEIFVEDRLSLQIATSGTISDPDVDLKTRLPDAEKMAKDYAKSKLLDYAIEKLRD